MPFHFRAFRFLNVQIDTGSVDLVLLSLDVKIVHYPLDILASFKVGPWNVSEDQLWQQLWNTSLRTLSNCMHDGYEDCPFYEQLQYEMDARSSSLFTYSISGDDRLARQAIIQLHNTFQSHIGLTASRAPTHRLQFIPHFSLYWICMIGDHLTYFGDFSLFRGSCQWSMPSYPNSILESITMACSHLKCDQESGILMDCHVETPWSSTSHRANRNINFHESTIRIHVAHCGASASCDREDIYRRGVSV